MANFYYVNSRGEKLDLNSGAYRLQSDTSLFSNTWAYTQNEYVSKVESFSHIFSEKDFTISIYAKDRNNFGNAINKLHNVFEYDVRKKSPGRLYYGDFFMRGYLIESSQDTFRFNMNYADKKLRFVCESGDWIRERLFKFSAGDDEQGSAEFLDYPYDFKHDMLNGTITKRLNNESASDADFRMVIYGSCVSPTVYINDWTYNVDVTLLTNEYLTIDTIDKTIIKKNLDTSETNCFHLRNKDSYIFKKLDVGMNNLVRQGSFGVDLTMYEYRSEPTWWT